MEPDEFWVIRTDGGRPEEGPPEGGYAVRLGWVEGVPYVIDLGSPGRIQVNGVPVEPRTPHILHPGDTITIGNTHLTWTVGEEVEETVEQPPATEAVTVVLPELHVTPDKPAYSVWVRTADGLEEFPLTDEPLRIGRSRDNEVCIDDEHVSRHHARITRQEEGYEIVDLGSVSGLTFQGELLSRRLLADGDVLWLSGSTSLLFRATQPAVTGEEAVPGAAVAAEPPAEEETTIVPEHRAPLAGTPTEEETVMVPKVAAEPVEAAPEAGEETVIVPKVAAEPVEAAPEAGEETVIVPKPAARPAEAMAEPEEETLIVPKPADRRSWAELLDETVIVGAVPRAAAPEAAGEEGEFEVDRETALVDMAQFLEGDTLVRGEPVAPTRDTETPYLVVHLEDQTWEVQFEKERLAIGRGEESDIAINDDFVSRQHGWIERRGDDYLIREAQSTNGIWLLGERITDHTLRDGDVLTIGRAKLVFKGGFSCDDLSLVGMPRVDGTRTRRPVVFVPGMMGSQLWVGSEQIWPSAKRMISEPEVFALPGDPRIEARGIVNDVVIVPHLFKLRQYSALGDYLEEGLGYTRGKDLLEFAYDWRQDVRLSAQRLAETVETWEPDGPVTIIAHSLGTLVARYYVERLGGAQFVERVLLMGGPHYGTPKGLSAVLVGPGMLPFGLGAERMRKVLATFPSAYQILPIYPCIVDQDETYIDALNDSTWLPEEQRPFLNAARSFRRELGNRSSVPTVSIFGYGFKTMLRLQIHRRSGGEWGSVDFVEDSAGDASVPSGSAVLKGSEIHPVLQEHGSLYTDDDVRMRLKVELTRSTTWQRRRQR